MKIGTLTLHLPFNYGNALQMLSLHRYLIEQGYDAEILSHWFQSGRAEILSIHHKLETFDGWIRFILNCLVFGGYFCQYRRESCLKKWLESKIKWSKERGCTGEFDPDKIDCDTVIVGSDQIWNPKYTSSDFFLLPDFKDEIKKIAYAASFGTDHFIKERKSFFEENLRRFKHVSMRESSAVEIVNKELHTDAMLVCDPTLLHTREEWCELLDFKLPKRSNGDLVMYFVTPDYRDHWRDAVELARTAKRKVHVFAYQWPHLVPVFSLRHPCSSLDLALRNLLLRARLFWSGVRMHLAATPSDFVRRIAESDGLVTDSFHGLMFATIFGKRCNVVVGENEERQQMSARLRNFTQDFGNPTILTSHIDYSAMQTLYVTPQLQKLIADSKVWLKKAIET